MANKPRTSYEEFMGPYKKLVGMSATENKQLKAQDALTKKRIAEAKKTGSWPNYNTN
jgi:hypothetical protein